VRTRGVSTIHPIPSIPLDRPASLASKRTHAHPRTQAYEDGRRLAALKRAQILAEVAREEERQQKAATATAAVGGGGGGARR